MAAIIGAVILAPTLSGAQAASKRKINIAGRQRMLTQRMAMAVMMMRQDITPDVQLDILQNARDLFDTSLGGLRSGSDVLGLPEERDPAILAALDVVRDSWADYDALVSGVLSRGKVSTGAMNRIANSNLRILGQANAVVKALVGVYGGADVSEGVAIAIDVAGRQRMLSQKMAKEAALIGLRVNLVDNRAALRQTIELFDSSLWSLMNGDAAKNIPVPPAEVLGQLQKVEELWRDTYPVLGEVADKGRADFFDLTEVALNQGPLLTDMNEAVQIYDNIG